MISLQNAVLRVHSQNVLTHIHDTGLKTFHPQAGSQSEIKRDRVA